MRPYRRPGAPVTAEVTIDLHADHVWIVRPARRTYELPDARSRFFTRAFTSELDAERYAEQLKDHRISPFTERIKVQRLGDVPEMLKVRKVKMRTDYTDPTVVPHTDLRGRDFFEPSDSPPHSEWEMNDEGEWSVVVTDVDLDRAMFIARREVERWLEANGLS